jgi:hypothetical protein
MRKPFTPLTEAESVKRNYYFFLCGKDGKEYRICRLSDNAPIAGGFGKTRHATEAEAKRHLARLERGEPLAA